GAYVQHGTTVTLAIELAKELPPEAVATPKAELQRVVTMIQRNFDGAIPQPGTLEDEDREFERAALAAVDAMESRLAEMKLDRGVAEVMVAVRFGHKYFDRTAPWALVKEGKLDRLATVLYTAAEALRVVSGLLYPIIPAKMAELRRALGVPEADVEPHLGKLREWGALTPGAKLGKLAPLFPRIDTKKKGEAKGKQGSKDGGKKKPKKEKKPAPVLTDADGLITIDTFFAAKLRVAHVLEAERVPEADRLLRLQVDLGDERRQIVAGIAEHYSPETIVGKRVVVVSNLKPAKIRGIESNGMLLAAKHDGRMTVVTLEGEVPAGSDVG
ncbi:MAG: methionine--tRNA ligase subunit beta, partial [Planctomycetota bacterium]